MSKNLHWWISKFSLHQVLLLQALLFQAKKIRYLIVFCTMHTYHIFYTFDQFLLLSEIVGAELHFVVMNLYNDTVVVYFALYFLSYSFSCCIWVWCFFCLFVFFYRYWELRWYIHRSKFQDLILRISWKAIVLYMDLGSFFSYVLFHILQNSLFHSQLMLSTSQCSSTVSCSQPFSFLL